jgi:hypothetical protein
MNHESDTPSTADLSLVLTDWFEEEEDMGYGTIHFAAEPYSHVSICGREGFAYQYYSSLTLADDPLLCASCEDIARRVIDAIISGETN